MADLSQVTILGIKVESTSGTYDAPSSSDLVLVADLKPSIEGLTTTVNEFTGSIHKPGPIVLGKSFSASGRILLRGPGGASPPAADAWIPGRLIRAAGFTEVVTATAVPTSPEAVGGTGSTTTATLGFTASTTVDVYKGMMILLSLLGSNKAGLTMVRSYSAAKLATLMETHTAAITSGNWQLPRQLTYLLSAGTPPTLSVSCWIGGRRINARGCAISAFKINLPTLSRDSQDVPSIEFTLTGDVQTIVDDASPPSAPTGLAIPPYRDGKLWIANKQLGGSSVSIDFGAQVGFPPNPNFTSGNETAQVTETTRTVDLTLNQVALTAFDDVALADAQGYSSLFGLWGLASGNAFGLAITDMRFNHRSPDNGGPFVTSTGSAFVDGVDKTIALSLPFNVTW